MFGNLFNLQRHELSAICQYDRDKKGGKMKCPSCSTFFASHANLKKHVKRFHLDEVPLAFACGLCDERFSTDSQLAKHRNEHHVRLEESDFQLRDSAHKRQSQSWRLVFPYDVDTMDRAFFYSWYVLAQTGNNTVLMM